MGSKTGSFLLLVLLFALVSAGSPGPNRSPNPRPRPRPRPRNLSDDFSDSDTRCPRNVLELGVCFNLLPGLLNVTLGQPPVDPCCTLLRDLADVEVAVCLCTALRGNIFGIINVNILIAINLLVNNCSRELPRGFIC